MYATSSFAKRFLEMSEIGVRLNDPVSFAEEVREANSEMLDTEYAHLQYAGREKL